jgi:hypothetical protein
MSSADQDDRGADRELEAVDAADVDVDRVVEATTDARRKREVMNPFDDGPATLFDAANEILRCFMQGERDGYLRLGEQHADWLDLLDRKRKLVLSCHRDGLKTSVILAYLALRLEYDPGFQAIWAMNNREIAISKAHSEFNKIVERNPWLVSLQEDGRERDTMKHKEFPNNSSLRVTWLDGGIDGDRAHLLVLDDLIKARGDGSPEDVREWVEGSATPMVKDDGRTVLMGTRKRRGDLYEHYRSLPAYEVAEYPAILDFWETAHENDDDVDERRPPADRYTEVPSPWGDGDETIRVLWPEARGPGWLRGKRDEMADFRFFREYCLALIGGEGSLVDRSEVNRPAEDGGCSYRGRDRPHRYEPTGDEYVVVGHDPAQSPTGDNAAFFVQLVREDGIRELLYARAEKGMAPSEIKNELEALNERYDPAYIIVEDNGMQAYVRNDAIETSDRLRAKIRGMATTSKKHSWRNGVPRLQTLVESGSIRFYRGDDGTEDFINAALSLELDDGKISGHLPDLVAAWYMAERGPEETEDDDDEGFLITQ